MRTLIALILLTVAGGASAASESPLNKRQAAVLERALLGKVPQAPVQCVARDLLNDVEPIGDTILLYRLGPKRLYRNDLVGRCSALGPGSIPVIQRVGPDYCAGDVVRTVDRQSGRLRGGACALGPFIAYRAREN
ncbi:hypothetical protein [Sphingobium algorifonticola]|uniref:Integron n=1 Tax=Sphingobium algorifonticola TaxID=2008318 RepID=A0A437J8A0_9SPHN|nr:hypothetical protein [Sphingobium algorifonticola]RVT41724.1 hypothetical protein ENE74_05390 [Sphingobium algorifonticola]